MKLNQIQSGLPVYAAVLASSRNSLRKVIGFVDHVEGSDYIKLKKDNSSSGKHHWIPTCWVEEIDANGIYLNKLEDEIRGGMFDSPPALLKSA